MANAPIFEEAIREYLAGRRDWDSVHQLALQMEIDNQSNFPPEFRRPLEELHFNFLADSQDDPQFRSSKAQIADLITELDRLKREVRVLGRDRVAERETSRLQQEEQTRRRSYVERHRRRHR